MYGMHRRKNLHPRCALEAGFNTSTSGGHSKARPSYRPGGNDWRIYWATLPF